MDGQHKQALHKSFIFWVLSIKVSTYYEISVNTIKKW